jgi:translation initiation factor 4E
MALQNSYNLSLRPTNSKTNKDYAATILPVATFDSCEGFWAAFSRCPRPDGTTTPVDTHLFKTGIQPIWEDEANRRGGKWIVRIPKGVAGHYWETIVLSIIGEQFDVGNEICGAVLSVRFSEDIIAIWNRHASNIDALHKIRDMLYKLLKLPDMVKIDYKPHDKSLHEIAPGRLAQLNGTQQRGGPVGHRGNERGGHHRGADQRNQGRFSRGPPRTNERRDRAQGSGMQRSPGRQNERRDERREQMGKPAVPGSVPRSPTRKQQRFDTTMAVDRGSDPPANTGAPEGRWR